LTPPVKSTGSLSGRRPSRDFDSLLHTAPIARGNSGGPLLDECGRVIGVNSFGAESGSADAEFFFAVSTRELLPFLTANEVSPQINSLPCRSLAELDAAEEQRAERARLQAEQRAVADAATLARQREDARRGIEFAIIAGRENGMAIAFLLVIGACGAGLYGLFLREFPREGSEDAPARGPKVAFIVAGLLVVGAGAAWLLRPGFGSVEDRLDEALDRTAAATPGGAEAGGAGDYICVLDADRSRVTGGAVEDVQLGWAQDGCVNGRTQYGQAGGRWARVLVPDDEAAVTVNRFDPATREYRVDRYLLGRDALAAIRQARGAYDPPQCGGDAAAALELGQHQQAITALLPAQPNERLVYSCRKSGE